MGETRPGDGADTADTGFDLFDRWLEHRHQAPGDGPDQLPADGPGNGAPAESAVARAPAPPPVPPRDGEQADAIHTGDTHTTGTPTTGAGSTTNTDVDHAGRRGEPSLSPPGGLSNSAGWAVLSAFRAAEAPPAADTVLGTSTPAPRPRRLTDAERGTPAFPLHRSPEHVEAGTQADPPATDSTDSTDTIEFAPRTRARRVVGVVLLASLVGTAAAAWAAYQNPGTTRVGTAATLAVLSLVIWALRAGSPPARLAVRRGELEVHRGGTRHRFDLTSRYTPIDVIGDPTGPGTWRVLFHRRSMAPFVVDASMVDPVEFTRVLERYRPRQD